MCQIFLGGVGILYQSFRYTPDELGRVGYVLLGLFRIGWVPQPDSAPQKTVAGETCTGNVGAAPHNRWMPVAHISSKPKLAEGAFHIGAVAL